MRGRFEIMDPFAQPRQPPRVRGFKAVEDLIDDPIILLTGKRGSGKSVGIAALCYAFKQRGTIDFAMGMSTTEESNGALQ
jgi:hypothetical protein